MLEVSTDIKTFKYVKPEAINRKKIVWLAKTDRLFATIQVIHQGGESNLHAHNHLDGFWFVISGRARFYSEETTVAGELDAHEGILIPRGVKYWFESVGDEPLELLQVECSDIAMKTQEHLMSDRVDFNPRKRSFGADQVDA